MVFIIIILWNRPAQHSLSILDMVQKCLRVIGSDESLQLRMVFPHTNSRFIHIPFVCHWQERRSTEAAFSKAAAL